MLGSDLADQIRERSEGTPLGDLMARIAPDIEKDRETLIGLLDELGTSKNPVKQASAWIAEKASRAKFGGATSGEPDLGLFMALETLTLGVEGKLSLWKVLKEIAGEHPPLAAADLDTLIERAQSQHDALESERISTGRRVLIESAAESDAAS
ncbi:MAG: hypothetical protein M3O25_01470 [Actinomycetota bacterium]|nr:hypothetical protein [Actinomycetota bacterium]